MSKTTAEIAIELDKKIHRSAVATRKGGNGVELSYLKGWYVIDRLNKVFGPLNWASSIVSLNMVHSGSVKDYNGEKLSTSYVAQVRLVVQASDGKATEHTEVGYGDGTDKSNLGKTHELAVKEAVTDALKRAAKNLGMSMGLALYDKDQENVDDTAIEVEPIKAIEAKQEQPLAVGSKEHDVVKRQIVASSKVVIMKGYATAADLKQKMKEKYGTDNKDELSFEQSKDLLNYLETELSRTN